MELEIPPITALPVMKYSLFLKRRFWPIFVSTFLGAFNDNLLRSGLVVLIAYSASKGIVLPARPEILVTLCSGLLILPLILFSSLAGPLADKYEKSFLVRLSKLAELGIMAGAFWGFSTQNIPALMLLLFISGTHTTFYSPIKFSILPDHLHNRELLAANGFMAGGSYLAILLGLITGGLLVEYPDNIIGAAAVGISIIGFIASVFIPRSRISEPDTIIDYHLWRGTKEIVSYALRDRIVARSILALSWFLLVGSVFMAQFANYAQGVIHGNNEVYILFLTVFSVGIAIGSLACDTLLKGEISLKMLPIAALGVSVFTALMVITTPPPMHEGWLDVWQFLQAPQHWSVLGSMLMVAVCGGLYIVPLYAMLQSHTPTPYRSRVMAASNLSDALCMTTAALVSALMLWVGFGILDLFVVIAVLNVGMVIYARKLCA